jgi:hypothetical protein
MMTDQMSLVSSEFEWQLNNIGCGDVTIGFKRKFSFLISRKCNFAKKNYQDVISRNTFISSKTTRFFVFAQNEKNNILQKQLIFANCPAATFGRTNIFGRFSQKQIFSLRSAKKLCHTNIFTEIVLLFFHMVLTSFVFFSWKLQESKLLLIFAKTFAKIFVCNSPRLSSLPTPWCRPNVE